MGKIRKQAKSSRGKTPKEIIQMQLKDKIEKLRKEIRNIDFMGYIGKKNPFSNEQLNEQIELGINQKINEVFGLEDA